MEHPNRSAKRARDGGTSLATLSDHLGLSKAAISRVLNAAPAARSIPQATQQRILLAAKQLNYRPNLLARSLRRGRSMTIGVLVPELSEGYATLVLAGLEETLSAAGYAFILITHHHRTEVLARTHEMFEERAVDGIVAVDTPLPAVGKIPTVTISCPDFSPDAHDSVTNILLDHDVAAELALTHLWQLGHRSIAIIKGQPFSSDTEPRWRSIQAAAARLGLQLRAELVAQLQEDLPTDEPGFHAAGRLLAGGTPFTALFAFNDVSAMGAIKALRQAGLGVPGDVSVVGFDDVRYASYHHPALTTVRQPLHRMGVLAGEAVLRRLAQQQGGQQQDAGSQQDAAHCLVVKPELIVRESTAPLTHGQAAQPRNGR